MMKWNYWAEDKPLLCGRMERIMEGVNTKNLAMQNLNRETMQYISETISAGMSLGKVRELCENYMLAHGADSFWYWDIGAFVFSGDETTVSVSGKQYQTSDRMIEENDIVTIDLSPQCDFYSRRTFFKNAK